MDIYRSAFRRNLDSISFAVVLQCELQIKASINKKKKMFQRWLVGLTHSASIAPPADAKKIEHRVFVSLWPSSHLHLRVVGVGGTYRILIYAECQRHTDNRMALLPWLAQRVTQ